MYRRGANSASPLLKSCAEQSGRHGVDQFYNNCPHIGHSTPPSAKHLNRITCGQVDKEGRIIWHIIIGAEGATCQVWYRRTGGGEFGPGG